MAGGRPTDYTEEIAEQICLSLQDGKSLRATCRELGILIQTVYNWLHNNPEFFEQYAKARDIQADTLADDLIDIADNAEDAAKARLQVDTRKWVASKIKPKKYGDRLDLGNSDDKPFKMEHSLNDEELDQLIADKISKVGTAKTSTGEGTQNQS